MRRMWGGGSLIAVLLNLSPEFSRRWCVLSDGVLSYYENERAVTPNGEIRASEMVCLAVPPPDTHG
jgi:Arf-GAP/Rho-GAP domain/ANK repeat/PH domain-containing protein 1